MCFPRKLGCLAFVLGLFLGSLAPASAADDPVPVEFAIYFTPKPSADPEAALVRLLGEPLRKLRLHDAGDSADAIASVQFKWSPLAEYAPPTRDTMRFHGVGISAEAADALVAAERVFIVLFWVQPSKILLGNRAAVQVMADLANATGGVIWDEETRQLFSLSRWKTDRIESWQGGLPDITRHVTMHAYADPELVRVITLGMRKFALPDLVVSDLPSIGTRPVGNCLNAVMQRLVEGQRQDKYQFKLTLSDIRHRAVRAKSLESPGDGAQGTVLIEFKEMPREEGDPHNLLLGLDFPDAKLSGRTERTLWGMAQLFGSTDKILNARSDDTELKAARDRARLAFFALERRFKAGLPLNEHLQVKGPFREGDQTEFMWVEVLKWGSDEVEGILVSDPFWVKKLHTGSRVTVRLDEVFDYIYKKADGTEEGNETSAIIERMQR